MKILFFIESLRSGGKERRLVELIKGLQKHPEIECELVLTKKNIHYKDIFDTGIKTHYIVRKHIKKDPRLFFLFYRICKKYKPDIIHAWGNMVAVYAIPTARLLKIKLINGSITYAAHIKVLSKIWINSKISFAFSDIIVSNSIAGLKTHKLVQNEKNKVIYNGYDFNRNKVKSTNLKKDLKISKNSLLVGMIGSFSEAKDYTTYIKVAEIVSKKIKNIHFLCVGDGLNRKQNEDLVYKNQIKNVHFLGVRSDIESICKELDIGVLLTNTNGHAEGISNAIMEMMASGLPVIATNAGGTTEVIQHKENGILVPAFDINAVRDNIKQLIENKNIREVLGRNAKITIKEKFRLEVMLNSYIKIYNDLVNEI